MVKVMCPPQKEDQTSKVKLTNDPMQLVIPSPSVQADKSNRSQNGMPSESRDQQSFDENDVEIVEMQLDNTNRSMEDQKKWLIPKPSKFEKGKGNSSTNDLIDFSSIRDHQQDHLIFTSDKPTHQPKMRLENGSVYEGEWMKGQKHGLGKLIWPNGSVYEVKSS